MGGRHTGTGTTDQSPLVQGAGNTNHVTIADMESDATYALIDLMGTSGYFGVFDNYVHDLGLLGPSLGAAGIFMIQATGLAIIGNKIDNIATSHCTRIGGADGGVISNNQFSRPHLAANHCLTLRGFTPTPGTVFGGAWCQNVVISDNIILSEMATGYMMHIAPQNNGYAERHRDIIVERNYFVSTSASTLFTEVIGTCTIRNNLFETDTGGFAIAVSAQSDIDNGSPTDTRIYNNTGYKKSTGGYSFIQISTETNYTAGYSPPTAITGLDIRNNLAYAPNAASAKFVDVVGLTPSYRAASSNNSSDTQVRTVRPWAAATPATYAEFAPASGSYAKDGGSTDVWAFEDFFGAAITGTRDIGAVQA
jgi:hypothetical protein